MRALLWCRRGSLLAGYLTTALWAWSELLVFSSAGSGWPALTAGGLWIAGLLAAIAIEVVGSLALYLLAAAAVVLTAAIATIFMTIWAMGIVPA